MKLAIMQPYFFPYIGYFQLLNAVDTFVVYDNIEFTKRGWFNRNQILLNGKAHMFTIPIRKDSDYLNVDQRYLADNAAKEIEKILRQIKSGYAKARFFKQTYPIIEECFRCARGNLFDFIHFSILKLAEHLQLSTKVLRSSEVEIDHSLKSENKVMAICNRLNASEYFNPVGGLALYEKEHFEKTGVILRFLRSGTNIYQQTHSPFVPSLSIIDVMMFHSLSDVKAMLNSNYKLI